jgi:hypothetical protein
VAKLGEHEIFDQGIRPKTPAAQTPAPTKPLGQIPNSNKSASASISHTRVASVQAAPTILPTSPAPLPLESRCASCHLEGHLVTACPTKKCGYCAVHGRVSTHFPQSCFHFDFIKGKVKPLVKTTAGKAKSSRSRSGKKSVTVEDDSSSPPELQDDSSSSEVSSLSVLFDSGSSEHIVPQQFLIQPSTLITEPRIEMESAFGEILSPSTVGTFKNLKPCYSCNAILSICTFVHIIWCFRVTC